jgi:class 3 adenylate cyclase/tetratricopeptide (TPR) repeat protein
MRCQECAHENTLGSRFCTACGTGLTIPCASCGHGVSPDARFCGWCGSARAGSQLAEPGGERKQATVLFADIVDSTVLIGGLDAEAARDRLEPLVRTMTAAVLRFNGTVLRTLGDGVKAAFGVPHAQEGHALLAAQAALAMQDAITADPDAPQIRVGLHSGEVVVGRLNTGSSFEQEAQGMTVHLASRIEQAATPGNIFISRECRDLLGAYCDTVEVGTRVLKSIPDPVEVHRLIGLKPAVNSEHFRAGSLVSLRGRSAELEVLQQALLDVGGQGGLNIIGVAGFPGVGKSRLCFEFGEWCRGRNVAVMEVRAQAFGQATPLLPILEMLRSFFRISPQLDPALAREAIGRRLLSLDASLTDSMPLLADFLGVADPSAPLPLLGPETRHAMVRAVLGEMVKAAGRRTSVIIVEDLHWLDGASQDFVDAMAEAVVDTNIVMVVTFRPPWSAPWTTRGRYQEVRLAELDQREMRQLVRDLAGDAPDLEQVVSHVADQSGGNPFFAEELILSLAQSGVLRGVRGAYRLAPSGWLNPVLPPTVEAVIGARIDRLAERQKAVLQIGAVIGKEFPLAVVQVVADIPAPALHALIARLCDAELIQPCSTGAGESFAFRHPLIQEVAYAMQLRTRRTGLHESVANAIGGFDWGQREEVSGLLAYHYESAGRQLEAAMHLHRAARWIGRTNSAQALADWKKVRLMMQGQPRSEANDRLRELASGQLLTFGWREGMSAEEAKIYADEALQFARESGNRKHEVLVLGGYGRIMAASGSADDYVALVREALALTDAESNPEGTLLLNGLLCQACGYAGLLVQAMAANDAALRIVEDEGQPDSGTVLGLSVEQMVGFDVLHWIKCLRVRLLVALGQFDEAQTWLGRVLQIDPDKVEPFHQSIPHLAGVELAWHRGDADAAKWHAAEIARYADQSAMPYVTVLAKICHGLSVSLRGDFDAAGPQYRGALDLARSSKAALEQEAKVLALLAEANVRAGNFAAAVRIAAEARETARRRTDRYAECHAAIVGAIALAACREAGWQWEAADLLDRAEMLIVETSAAVFRPILGEAHLLVDTVEGKGF